MKPCYLCKSRNLEFKHTDTRDCYYSYVECKDCGFLGPITDTPMGPQLTNTERGHEAVRHWNGVPLLRRETDADCE